MERVMVCGVGEAGTMRCKMIPGRRRKEPCVYELGRELLRRRGPRFAESPAATACHPHLHLKTRFSRVSPTDASTPIKTFGTHDDTTLRQIADVASRAERAALMADGHVG